MPKNDFVDNKTTNTAQANARRANKLIDNSSLVIANFENDIAYQIQVIMEFRSKVLKKQSLKGTPQTCCAENPQAKVYDYA